VYVKVERCYVCSNRGTNPGLTTRWYRHRNRPNLAPSLSEFCVLDKAFAKYLVYSSSKTGLTMAALVLVSAGLFRVRITSLMAVACRQCDT